ncbi:MAG TPA: SRPBCC family protein [Flavobacterium sp.]|nr:SRPBCC family protein [Flavobacterium sp.]
MRILKYVFLLMLLVLVALTVYVATQKGEFTVTRSIVIDLPRKTVARYVNDYGNWAAWSAWKQDAPDAVFRHSDISSGVGAWVQWEGAGGGKLTTLSSSVDSVSHKARFYDEAGQSSLRFSDTLGKTKVTWKIKGHVDFMTKINATFGGGVNGLMSDLVERSLESLRKTLTYEIKTYSIRVSGNARKTGGFYLKQTFTCSETDADVRIANAISKLEKLLRKQRTAMAGTPFVLHEAFDYPTRRVTLSVCVPLREEIFVSSGSDISVGFLDPFYAVKATLTGDYSHRKAALAKAADWMQEKGIAEATNLKRVDVYVKYAPGTGRPSQWVTDYLIPTGQAVMASEPTSDTPSDMDATNGSVSPSPASPARTTTSTSRVSPARPQATATPAQNASPAHAPPAANEADGNRTRP